MLNFKQSSKQVCCDNTLLSILDTVKNIEVVLKGIESKRRKHKSVRLVTCLRCHLNTCLSNVLNRIRRILIPLDSLVSRRSSIYTRNLTAPDTSLKELCSPFHFATDKHLLRYEISRISVSIKRLVIVCALLRSNILVECMLTAVVRVTCFNTVIAAGRLTCCATYLCFITHEVTFVVDVENI